MNKRQRKKAYRKSFPGTRRQQLLWVAVLRSFTNFPTEIRGTFTSHTLWAPRDVAGDGKITFRRLKRIGPVEPLESGDVVINPWTSPPGYGEVP